MRCPRCGVELDRPGDYCLRCEEGSTDAVVIDIGVERTTLAMMDAEALLGRTTITTQPEDADPAREVQRRNYVARIADEVRRKRPDAIYVHGERDLVGRLRGRLGVQVYRIDGEDPVSAYRERIASPELAVVDRSPAEKLGGRHSSVIGGRRGERILGLLGEHPHVKKIVPGPIDGSGSGSRGGFRVKVTRPGAGGNLRVLLHDGSTVQEVRLVTTAGDRDDGERIADQLNDALGDADVLA